jgi:predicted permease
VNLVLTVAGVAAPVATLAALGFLWARLGFDYPLAFVTRLSMSLAVPCLMFTGLMKSTVAPAALTEILLASVMAYAVVTAVFWGLCYLGRLDRRTYLGPAIFGNTGNLGLPLAFFAFGETGLQLAIVVFAVMAVWSFSFGVWLVSGGGSPLRVVQEPVVGATLLGALFLSQGWQTPAWITRSLDLVAQLAIPLMLITLGVAMARLTAGRLGRAFALSAGRTVVGLAVAVAIALALGLEPVAAAVLILQVTTPVAVTSYMLAAKYGADAEAVAGLVIASTALSVATLPLTLAFLI